MKREIEERGEEAWGGRHLEGVVPPVSIGLPRRGAGAPSAPRRAAFLHGARACSGARRSRELLDRLPFAGLRRALGRERGVRWRTVPATPLVATADVTRLERSLVAASPGAWLPSLTPVLLRAVAGGLRAFPRALGGARSAVYGRIHVGVALFTARGLRVPVLRDADRKDARELERELAALARRAREEERPFYEPRCATFCDLGALGREDLPQHLLEEDGVVLGAGLADGAPRCARGAVAGRRSLRLTLALRGGGEARVEGARFLRWLTRAIEDPRLLAFAG